MVGPDSQVTFNRGSRGGRRIRPASASTSAGSGLKATAATWPPPTRHLPAATVAEFGSRRRASDCVPALGQVRDHDEISRDGKAESGVRNATATARFVVGAENLASVFFADAAQ